MSEYSVFPHSTLPAQGLPLTASWMLWSQEEGRGLKRLKNLAHWLLIAVGGNLMSPQPPFQCFLTVVLTCQGSRQAQDLINTVAQKCCFAPLGSSLYGGNPAQEAYRLGKTEGEFILFRVGH